MKTARIDFVYRLSGYELPKTRQFAWSIGTNIHSESFDEFIYYTAYKARPSAWSLVWHYGAKSTFVL